MLNETRVNLKHLLEDIRDSYSSPLEEVIITELIANTLDSKANRIDFIVSLENNFLRCTDNGLGMKRYQLKEYHNIAASSKQRGQGIGFAGVGSKLSLLLAEKVITESRGGYGSRAATEWRLTNTYRAPWKFIPTADLVKSSRGTTVTIFFNDNQTHLLKPDFVRNAIMKHFYALFHDKLREKILRYFYKKPVEFTINGELLILPEPAQRTDRDFMIYLGKSRRPIGAGFLIKKVFDQSWFQKLTIPKYKEDELPAGLSISTFGKVIKSGWEWLGILPKTQESLCGMVEIPALSSLLTTNKDNFLSDSTHLNQYYKIRKAVQEAILPVLKSLGEYGDTIQIKPTQNIKPLTRQIENALGNITEEFPELTPLLGSRYKNASNSNKGKHGGDSSQLTISSPASFKESRKSVKTNQRQEEINKKDNQAQSKIKKPGLTIALEELRDIPGSLGRIIENTIFVNTLHPAWQKALKQNQQEYHILLTVGLILSEFLAPEKNPQKFLGGLITSWGRLGQTKTTLL